MEVIEASNKSVLKAVSVINDGGVVVFPTDTVYGFLADATNEKAVLKIFKIKKRSKAKILPVFVKDLKMASELVLIEEDQKKKIKKFWPGKYTFVFKEKKPIDSEVIGVSKLCISKKTIAIRIPKYKFLNVLLKKINKPIAQTSANISGCPATGNIDDIIDIFENKAIKPDLIINAGKLKKSKPSKIVDLSKETAKFLRK